MRRPGDQHRPTPASANPFLPPQSHITEYTAAEIATLQSRLEKQLGPEYISTRPGAGGGKVHYLAAEKVINLANEVFGFNGWSSAIQNVQVDFVDESPSSGKITLGLSTIVRVTLRDGTFHEDIGYGHIENCKGKAAAFEKAKKEAATDALKRALRNFGNVLGNCLYDKDYLSKVTKVKVAPSKWDADNLHRHPDYAPIKKEAIADPAPAQASKEVVRRQTSVQSGVSFGSAEFEDDFGASGLDDADFAHPDEVRLDDSVHQPESPANKIVSGQQQKQGVQRMHSMPQLRPPNVQPPQLVTGAQAPQRPQAVQRPVNNGHQAMQNREPPPPQNHGSSRPHPQPAQQIQNGGLKLPHQADQQHAPQPPSDGSRSNSSSATAVADSPAARQQMQHAQINSVVSNADGQMLDPNGLPIPRQPPPGAPEGFVTGRSVDLLNAPPESRPGNAAPVPFNPHTDSPSIRRTHGINPGISAPVRRTALQGGPSTPAAGPSNGNGTNGQFTPMRPGGMTTNFINPAADTNRRIGAPPASSGMQNRGAYRPPMAVGVKRPPLSDVSNVHQAPMDGASDAKKPRTEDAAAPATTVAAGGEAAAAEVAS